MELPAEQFPTARCASHDCGALIIWALTAAEKPIPVDARPHEKGNIRLSRRGRQVRADVLSKTKQAAAVGDPLYRSHFVTCTRAKDWRRT